MRGFGRVISAVILAVAGSTLAAPEVRAQACSGPVCGAPAPMGSACRVFMSASNGSGSYAPGASEEPAGCFDPARVYGLQGWHFRAEGGREVSNFSLRQTNTGLDFAFADINGGEEVKGYAWLVPLPVGTEPLTVTATGCAGICRVSLGPLPANSVFVLRGFNFERTGGEGAIQTVAVGPLLRSATGVGALTVDFRDIEFAYRANIDYALVPADAVTGPSSTGGAYSGGSAALVGLSNVGDAVLSGFSFKYGGGGHPLEEVGLELGGLGYEVWYQGPEAEENRRHPELPFDWEADYIILN
jgi:hypothetical protein